MLFQRFAVLSNARIQFNLHKRHCTSKTVVTSNSNEKFETVYSFPHIKYFALFIRLKTYHIAGSCIGIPGSGLLEMLNVLPQHSFLTAAYIGITGACVLSAASWPFKNTIGFLYISDDNQKIKISSIDFWGKRVDRVVPAEDWMPLLDMSPKKLDILYLSPELADKTQYKWFVKFGKVFNSRKIVLHEPPPVEYVHSLPATVLGHSLEDDALNALKRASCLSFV